MFSFWPKLSNHLLFMGTTLFIRLYVEVVSKHATISLFCLNAVLQIFASETPTHAFHKPVHITGCFLYGIHHLFVKHIHERGSDKSNCSFRP